MFWYYQEKTTGEFIAVDRDSASSDMSPFFPRYKARTLSGIIEVSLVDLGKHGKYQRVRRQDVPPGLLQADKPHEAPEKPSLKDCIKLSSAQRAALCLLAEVGSLAFGYIHCRRDTVQSLEKKGLIYGFDWNKKEVAITEIGKKLVSELKGR